MTAVFEWRSEYRANLVETQDGNIEVIINITEEIIIVIVNHTASN